MRRIELDAWDDGRLLVNRAFAGLLKRHDLTTFDALMDHGLGRSVKATLEHRTTASFELAGDEGSRRYYIKRHESAPLKEYIKPLLRLGRPFIGAEPEWKAMLRFHELGIPSMTPVAYGRAGSRSFVMTLGIEGCTKLSDWMETNLEHPDAAARSQARAITQQVASVVRTMHNAGMHHQDLYLGHLLLEGDAPDRRIHVIDLGRIGVHRRLPMRWIIKDLAQLDFSSDRFSCRDRVRFLRTYFGRPLKRSDRWLIGLIRRKSRAIARHARRR